MAGLAEWACAAESAHSACLRGPFGDLTTSCWLAITSVFDGDCGRQILPGQAVVLMSAEVGDRGPETKYKSFFRFIFARLKN